MTKNSSGTPSEEVASPCIGICMMNDTLGYCLGCGRTRFEIGSWAALASHERREVIRLAQARSGLTLVKPDGRDKA